ncbi:hypothetical protein [Streptomyces lasiicapitis]|uniref:hypothetical protein n=1 Tax=Streptomyces lasiicapitis TaxID=1923961 RepID=UPI0036755D34
MHDEENGCSQALIELRRRLADGLARARLNQTQLAARAELGRTTVSEALSPKKPVPSAETVAALARALKLPVQGLLALRRTAAGRLGGVTSDQSVLGRLIGEWDPHDLEVHPAGATTRGAGSGSRRRVLPGYVERAHDRVLAEAVRDAAGGRSRMVVLVGTSSTGKTRACWEAVQPLAERGWRLWHPFDPPPAKAALKGLPCVGPRTVVWLNEAQHYFGDRRAGERIAADVHHLLVQPERRPVLVLGTLWTDYSNQYTALPDPRAPDPYSRVRELLAGRTVTVPEAFDEQALAAAAILADEGDWLLADALTRARAHGRLTQDLAGAPELLHRYERVSPAAKAVLEAAMDARRLGVGLNLPHAFLTAAAADYLNATDYGQLTEDWAEAAFAELARPVHGKQAPLRRARPRPERRPPGPPPTAAPYPSAAGPVFRLTDYLEQHGRTIRRRLCPPASFWHAAYTYLTHPDDLANLTQAAQGRHRLQWTHHLRQRAADQGDTGALLHLAGRRHMAGDRAGAEALYQRAADLGNKEALHHLAQSREDAGDQAAAEALYQRAADQGDANAMFLLAAKRERAGDQAGAEVLYQRVADLGDPYALFRLTQKREEAGDQAAAEALARRAIDCGTPDALFRLAQKREGTGNRASVEALYRESADEGHAGALTGLARLRDMAGDRKGAETLYQQAADLGDTEALIWVARSRDMAGDREGAASFYEQVTAQHEADHLVAEAERREMIDNWGPGPRYGDTDALLRLARQRERAGDRAGAETLYRQAADCGDTREAASFLYFDERWPHGLDPDGTPTSPWQ